MRMFFLHMSNMRQQICHISQCQIPTSRHVQMLVCGKFLSVDGEFVVQQVVELLCARPLVVLYNVPAAGVRVVEFGSSAEHLQTTVEICRYR